LLSFDSNFSAKLKALPTLTREDLVELKETKKYVLIDNVICDVSVFLENHPGGKNIITTYLYTDVGRFLTGTESFDTNFEKH